MLRARGEHVVLAVASLASAGLLLCAERRRHRPDPPKPVVQSGRQITRGHLRLILPDSVTA